jgi:hypothetical protein
MSSLIGILSDKFEKSEHIYVAEGDFRNFFSPNTQPEPRKQFRNSGQEFKGSPILLQDVLPDTGLALESVNSSSNLLDVDGFWPPSVGN